MKELIYFAALIFGITVPAGLLLDWAAANSRVAFWLLVAAFGAGAGILFMVAR